MVSSIVWVNIFCSAANCASIAGIILSSNRSFRVLNWLAWSRLGEGGVSVSLIMMVSQVELGFLVIGFILVCELNLVKKVVWRVGGTIVVSKICPSWVLSLSGGDWVLGGWSAIGG